MENSPYRTCAYSVERGVDIERVDLVNSRKDNLHDFDNLVAQHSDKALRIAYLITGSRKAAEDAAQEAFVKFYGEIGLRRSADVFEPRFYEILTGLSRRSAGGSSDGINDNETHRFIRSALVKLPAALRTAVVLHCNGFSIKEIAVILKCREGAVRSRLNRAYKQLVNEMKLAPARITD
ncbi:MAG: RNA polymerase sigma factor [Bacillota bacterium]